MDKDKEEFKLTTVVTGPSLALFWCSFMIIIMGRLLGSWGESFK